MELEIILETDDLSKIKSYVDILYEKIYSDEDLFYKINKSEIKLYLSRFEINKNYNSNYLFK